MSPGIAVATVPVRLAVQRGPPAPIRADEPECDHVCARPEWERDRVRRQKGSSHSVHTLRGAKTLEKPLQDP